MVPVYSTEGISTEVNLSFAERTPFNLVMNIVRVGVMAIIGILLVPYYINTLGMAAYGIIPLATTISGYLMNITDSMGTACNRYSTLAIRNNGDASRELSTSFFGIGRFCLVLLPIALFISFCTPWLFGIGDIPANDVRIMFGLILTSSLIYALTTAFLPVFNSVNKNYRYDFVRAVYLLTQFAMIIALFGFEHPSLVYIGVAYFVSSIVALLLMYIIAKTTRPSMTLKYSLYDRDLFRSIGTLGFWGIVDRLGVLLFFQASLVIVNIMIGSYYGGRFAIIATSVSMLNTICLSLITTISPHLYRAYTENDREKFVKTVGLTLKIVAVFIAVPVAFIAVFSRELLTIWVGGEHMELYAMLNIAILCNMAFSIASVLEEVPAIFLKADRMAAITMAFAVINIIVCSVAIAMGYGLDGAVWATGLCTLAYGVVRIYFNQRIVGAESFRFLKYLVYSAVTLAAFYGLFYLIRSAGVIGNSFVELALLGLIVFVPFAMIAIKLFSDEEKKMLEMTIPGFMKSLFIRLFE